MIVKVVPMRPIPGILPKNKWIDSEMELDLNKNEIVRCMQFGNVYDMNGNVINQEYISGLDMGSSITFLPKLGNTIAVGVGKQLTHPDTPAVEPVIVKEKPVEPVIIKEEPVKVESVEIPVEEHLEQGLDFTNEEFVKDYTIEIVSCKKEEEYIYLETEFKTSVGKIGGNMYGLFTITSGTRPSMEFMNNDNWVKFNNKFADYDVIANGDKFVFRFLPKNKSVIGYRLVIKEKNNNEVLAKLEGNINPNEL